MSDMLVQNAYILGTKTKKASDSTHLSGNGSFDELDSVILHVFTDQTL